MTRELWQQFIVQRMMYDTWEDVVGTDTLPAASRYFHEQIERYNTGVITVSKWRIIKRTEEYVMGRRD